jgi:hypothetical protein
MMNSLIPVFFAMLEEPSTSQLAPISIRMSPAASRRNCTTIIFILIFPDQGAKIEIKVGIFVTYIVVL